MKKWLIRKYNGSLGGLYSKKVDGLKGRPHLKFYLQYGQK